MRLQTLVCGLLVYLTLKDTYRRIHFESGWRGDDFIGKNTTDPTVLKPAKWLRETNVITTHGIAQADGDSDHSNLQGTE